jgi:DNA-directed RNA polymerase subunit RPC12/RpoP
MAIVPVITQCPKCGKKLKAPDDKVGKKAKCPQCGKPFLIQPLGAGSGPKRVAGKAATTKPTVSKPTVSKPTVPKPTVPKPTVPKPTVPKPTVSKPAPEQPAPAQPLSPQPAAQADAWYVQTADRAEYGPVTRAELDQWVIEERIDTECQILQEGSDQWQWAEEVLPQLVDSGQAETTENPFAGIADTSPSVIVDTAPRDGGDVNPFASPTETVATAEPSAAVTAEPSAAVSEKIAKSMEGTRPWVLFFSVLAFVFGGFYALFAMLSLIGIRQSIVGTLLMFLIMGAYASIFGFIGYLLLTYSKEAGAVARSRSVAALEQALESQRSFWKTVGILAIVLIAITVLMVIASFLFVGIFAAMAGPNAG